MTVVPNRYSDPKQTRLQQWLRIDPQQKSKVYAQIFNTAEISSLSYWLEIVFSASIAALGLVLNSPAVIIGAMLISPLMGPIMAAGLALAAGDLYLAVKAIANLTASVSLAIAFSAFIVWLLPFHSVTGEILARTNPTLLDLGVALLSGLAGSVAVCRFGGGEAVTTLPGVAIAVALMPPLCTIGFGLGSGANTRIMGGAGLLFLTNLVAIVASAFVVFLLTGMNAPEVRAEMEHSGKGEALAQTILGGRFSRALISGGQLRWRILMLVVLLGAIALPLRTAFMQVAGEAVARNAIQEVVKNLLPPGALVSQQVEVGRDSVAIRLISTRVVAKDKIQKAEGEIERRCARKVVLSVASIASQSELAELMQRFSTPTQPAPVTPESLEDIHHEVITRVQPVLAEVWPPEAPLQDFDVGFNATGMVLTVLYKSDHDLGKISEDILTRDLQERLGAPTISLVAQRVHQPRNRTRKAKREPNQPGGPAGV
jgi:uncharacterized hydrophobic protein (TIGR00271 family)